MTTTAAVGATRIRVRRPAALCALGAAVVWLVVWAHQQHAHGSGETDEMRVVAGMTWLDSGKLLPVAFALLLPGLALVARGAATGVRGYRPAVVAAPVLAALLAATAAARFLPAVWGTYEPSAALPPAWTTVVGTVHVFGAFALATALLALAARQPLERPMPMIVLVALAGGVVAGGAVTPVMVWPALAFGLFGGWLWRLADEPAGVHSVR